MEMGEAGIPPLPLLWGWVLLVLAYSLVGPWAGCSLHSKLLLVPDPHHLHCRTQILVSMHAPTPHPSRLFPKDLSMSC